MKRLVFAAVAVLSSCATTSPAPPLTDAQIDQHFLQAAHERAVFELPCAAADITTSFLGDRTTAGMQTSDRVVAVVGCDHRAVYVARCTMTLGEGRDVVVAARCAAVLNTATTSPTP